MIHLKMMGNCFLLKESFYLIRNGSFKKPQQMLTTSKIKKNVQANKAQYATFPNIMRVFYILDKDISIHCKLSFTTNRH